MEISLISDFATCPLMDGSVMEMDKKDRKWDGLFVMGIYHRINNFTNTFG
jgi:hypothetical protein